MFQEVKINGVEYSSKVLNAGKAIEIAGYGNSRGEEAISSLIRNAFSRTDGADIDEWNLSAAQRYMMVAAYLCMEENGGELALGEYAVGGGVLVEYINQFGTIDLQKSIDAGEFNGQSYSVSPLLGWHCDVIERVVSMNYPHEKWQYLPKSAFYELCAVATQLQISGEDEMPTDSKQTQQACEFVLSRVETILNHKESDFVAIMGMYYNGANRIIDIMNVGFCDNGFCVLPSNESIAEDREGDGAHTLHPVMFPAISCISEVSARLGKKFNEND